MAVKDILGNKKTETDHPKPTKVTTGKTTIRKKSEGRKILEAVFPVGGIDVKGAIVNEIVVPMIKGGLQEAFDRILYPDGNSPVRRNSYWNRGVPASRVNYAAQYSPSTPRQRYIPAGSSSGLDYDLIQFESRGDAETTLMALDDHIDRYGMATVGALFDISGASTDNPQVEKFCWRSIEGSKPVRVSDGWVLKLPRPIPID